MDLKIDQLNEISAEINPHDPASIDHAIARLRGLQINLVTAAHGRALTGLSRLDSALAQVAMPHEKRTQVRSSLLHGKTGPVLLAGATDDKPIKLEIAEVDRALSQANLPTNTRIAIKGVLARGGLV